MEAFWRSTSRSSSSDLTPLERSRRSAMARMMRRRATGRVESIRSASLTASRMAARSPWTRSTSSASLSLEPSRVKSWSSLGSLLKESSAVSPPSPASSSVNSEALERSLARMAAEFALAWITTTTEIGSRSDSTCIFRATLLS